MAAQTQTVAGLPESKPMTAWILPVLAGWLVPGAGHLILKKSGRGILIFSAVVLMFLFGLFMRGTMFVPEKGTDYLTSLINYGGFICDLASGGLFLLASMFGYAQPDAAGAVHDYGTKFLVSAGLLNILSMVDVWEIATGQKD